MKNCCGCASQSRRGAPARSRRLSRMICGTMPKIRSCSIIAIGILFNSADDPVKMVFHPEFVTPTSPLFNLDYQQFVRGCHMGIFPSYYEPWGYTPMECVALGLPAVTTDLSGFGAYVQHHIPNAAHQGICVLNRRTKSFEETTNNLVDYLMSFVQMNRRQRIEMRNRVERLSELFDWSALVVHYHEAHDLALERGAAGRPQAGRLEVRFA